jgi:hypothetical protein
LPGDATRVEALRALVASGQLEFTGGGWVQPDEAITRFEDLVDGAALGHLFLSSVLGHAPVRVGWSADPFGHSSTAAFLASLNAYNAHVLGRPMSPHDPINDVNAALWHPMNSMPDGGAFDPASSVMTHSTLGYWEPYRSLVGALSAGNVTAAASILEAYAEAQANRQPFAANVLVLAGDDAPMQSPWEQIYPVLDAVLEQLNARSAVTNVTYAYSSASKWVAALAAESPAPMPSRDPATSDMVPLVGNEFPYWTGYHVSRPEFKQIYHDGSATFRASSMLHALARDERTWTGGIAQLLTLWRAVALTQHHDIITGDCYDAVAEDNALRVRTGVNNAAGVASAAAALLLNADAADVGTLCSNFSLTPCSAFVSALESRSPVVVTLFNPLAWTSPVFVNLLSPTASIVVTDATGAIVPSQTAPYSAPDLPQSTTWYSLVIQAMLPPLGVASYMVTAIAVKAPAAAARERTPGASIMLSNQNLTATFSSNGTLLSLALPSAPPLPVLAKMLYYTSKGGSENAWDFSTDGLTTAYDFPGASSQSVAWLTQGDLFSEIAVSVDAAQGVFLRYRLYAGEAHLHVYASSGPFASNSTSTDSLLRLETGVASGAIFLTDSQGLELQTRVRWARPWFSGNYTGMAGNEPVAINQFPFTAAAVLPDADAASASLFMVTANSHWATSMASGTLEVGLNRNVVDDKGERFTGNRLVTQHLLLGVAPSRVAATTAVRARAAVMSNPPLLFAAGGARPSPVFAPLEALPDQVALISLQLLPQGFNLSAFFATGVTSPHAPPPVSTGSLLLRLRHIYQGGMDDSALAAPVTFDLAAVFAPSFTVKALVEMAVDASQSLAEARAAQVQWPQAASGGGGEASPSILAEMSGSGTVLTMAPMQLRTFLVQLAP